MQAEHEKEIETYFRASATPLSSNFSWLVMQRIYESKLRQARRRAILESALLALVTLITGILLLAGYFAWTAEESWLLPPVPSFVFPAVTTLFLLVLLDSVPALLRR